MGTKSIGNETKFGLSNTVFIGVPLRDEWGHKKLDKADGNDNKGGNKARKKCI